MANPATPTRRRFLSSLAATAAAASLSPRLLAQLIPNHRIGLQLFSAPKLLEADLPAALALFQRMGYQEVELYGPYPFSDPTTQERWAQTAKSLGFSASGYFGRSEAELAKLLKEHALAVPSLHTDLLTLENRLGPLAEAANRLGATYVTLPSIPEARRRTLDDYKRMADTFNAIGEAARRAGVTFAYHNHGYGLKAADGQVPLDVLLKATDPVLVALEMDVYWTAAGGRDPLEMLRTYAGRYRMLHLKDMAKAVRFSGDGGNSAQWIELFPFMTTAGDGVLPLKAIVEEGRKTGVRHFIVEQDMVAGPEVALKRSFDYLAGL